MRIEIIKVDILDWYDGVVSGLVYAQQGVFFVYLLAFDPDSDRRKLAVLTLTEDEAMQLQSALKDNRSAVFGSAVSKIVPTGRKVYWTEKGPEVNQSWDLHGFNENQIPTPPLFPGIERAVEEDAIRYWLGE